MIEFKDNEFLRQFQTKVGEEIAYIEYALQERKIFLTKVYFPDSVTDQEFKNDFIKSVLEEVKERGLHMVPTSSEVTSFIRKNKEYRDLLPVGIRI